jgi:hypothetical protein
VRECAARKALGALDMGTTAAMPQGGSSMTKSEERQAILDRFILNKAFDFGLAVHECGHAVCALANGGHVLKIQSGVRNHFTLYNPATFTDTQVRKIVSIAGPVAESDFLKTVGLKGEVCSAGDVARLLEYEESPGGDMQEKLRARIRHEKDAQVAALAASLDDHLMNEKDLPYKFQHLLGLIKQARDILTAHHDLHDDLVTALFDKGGVLRKSDIQRIWEASEGVDRNHETDADTAVELALNASGDTMFTTRQAARDYPRETAA